LRYSYVYVSPLGAWVTNRAQRVRSRTV